MSSAGDYKWVGGTEPLLARCCGLGAAQGRPRGCPETCVVGVISRSPCAPSPPKGNVKVGGGAGDRSQRGTRPADSRLYSGGDDSKGFASQCNQRVSTGLPGKGGRPGCCQEADPRSRSPRPQRGRAAQFTYRPCVHRASCRAVQACYGGGPRWTTSRAHANAPTLTAAVLASLGGGFMSAVAGILGRAG